jgi:hypothetical protein
VIVPKATIEAIQAIASVIEKKIMDKHNTLKNITKS